MSKIKKGPSEFAKKINTTLGEKVYFLRLARGWSRGLLAEKIGVTHQQLLKYEKGGNAISIARLIQIANIFELSLEYFYKDFEKNHYENIPTHHQRMCLSVSENFMRIENSDQQNAVHILLKALVKHK